MPIGDLPAARSAAIGSLLLVGCSASKGRGLGRHQGQHPRDAFVQPLPLLLTTITTTGTFWAKTDFSRRGDRLDRLGPGTSVPVFDLAALRAAALFGAKA